MAAESGEANAGIKRGTEQKTGAGRKTGITTRTEGQRGTGPETGRAGRRTTSGGIKKTGTDTGRTEKLNGRVGAEAEKRGIKAERRRRAGRGIAATAERGSASGMGSALTNAAAAKRGVATSGSPVTSIVNTLNGEEVRVQSKRNGTASTFLSALLSGQTWSPSEGASSVSVLRSCSAKCNVDSHLFSFFQSLLEHC